MTTDSVDRGRESFDRGAWGEAFAHLCAADAHEPLGSGDLERLAVAAHLVGEDEGSAEAWERAHRGHVEAGEVARAARCAFWLALGLFNRGEAARAGGWLGRAQRLIDDHDLDTVERGYLIVPAALRALNDEGDAEGAYDLFEQVAACGERFDDVDLTTMGRLGEGHSLIRLGRVDDGVALLDEVMVAVTREEVSPIVTGTVYCAVILACREVFDLRRATEWTEALHAWCEAQPDLVPFRGQCLVHRSEIMQFHGEWGDAWDEAQRAADRLSDPPGQPAIGMAHYQQGELLRLRGRFTQAEGAYRRASEAGHDPYPGLALLRLAQGRVEEAGAAIRRAIQAARDRLDRARMLAACVEISLAEEEVARARATADELADLATDLDAPLLQAMAAQADGVVALAEGDADAALGAITDACARWQELEAPYEHAIARVAFARACRALGDESTAEMELHAAREVLEELGATPVVEEIATLLGETPDDTGVLTQRQLEVLTLVADGKTNQEVAAELVLSEHTVRRHLQNLYTRIGVSSRAEAVAWAAERGLL